LDVSASENKYFILFTTHLFSLILGWRHIRLQQGGKNASGQTHYLSLSGFELYGTVTGVCDELGDY
jgi:hypothetical protein